ncbi:chemotaxis protein CheW [Tsuneonella mangrovi]|uniref:chemotaxis protein CheW n=1 Tax=Tsuneonella mangrovi TaxID=1982042 RepID=UPI000BA29D82|nr:chemotaxis protein CheW [Tsuneonella mangrovi]
MSALYLIVVLGGEQVAIPAVAVESVIELERLTAVPRSAAHVAGVTALRSRPLTVIDCARSLELEGVQTNLKEGRGVVVTIDGHLFALAVDDVQDVVDIADDPDNVPVTLGPQWDRVAAGMIETDRGAILVVDPQSIITGPATARAA